MAALSRREFLKVGLLSTASLAFKWPGERSHQLGRVTRDYQEVRLRPTAESRRLSWLRMDELITVEDTVLGSDGRPWHDIGHGYVPSGEVQPIERHLNQVVDEIPSSGLIGEVTVPFTDAWRMPDPTSLRIYRLYYSSTYWIRAIAASPGGESYYRLYDERLGVYYFVRAMDLRVIPGADFLPLNPSMTAKRLVVNLKTQTLTAWEGSTEVFRTAISAGRLYKPIGEFSARSWTPAGHFQIERKRPTRHMGSGDAAGSTYELPGVPWVSYFHWKGFAFHGTWWHNDFGRPRSSGCVNMRPSDAHWVYRWSLPFPVASEEVTVRSGTLVQVVED